MTATVLTPDVNRIFSKLPSEIRQSLSATNGLYHFLPATILHPLCRRLSIDETQLGAELLPLATSFAVAPVSGFKVGAVAFDSDGNAYLGANFEFADSHIAQTIHAEQSVIANAWACGAKDLALLLVNHPPCGHCRQFINEVNLADDFRIQLPDRTPQKLAYYLPDAFGPADLGVVERLLGGTPIDSGGGDLAAAAKAACTASYAPYSHSRSGVALQYRDGDIVMGCYAENAAFNPSLPPLPMALNSRRLQGKDWRSIKTAIMLESPQTLSQKHNTQALLATLGIQLDYSDC